MVDILSGESRPAMSSKACAFSIAALVGDDICDDQEEKVALSSTDEPRSLEEQCISPIGKSIDVFYYSNMHIKLALNNVLIIP